MPMGLARLAPSAPRRGLALTLVVALSAGTVAVTEPARAEAALMTDKEIRQTVRGKRIYLQTPLGGEFPLYYKADGTVDGSGEALGLGRFMAPKDQGKWWIKSNRLCQQWQEWYDGKPHCFELARVNETMLYWKRDDGLEGEARIGQ